MILEHLEHLQQTTGRRELRRFGLMVGGVLALAGLGVFLWGASWHTWLWGIGTGLMVMGTVLPAYLRGIYLPWMMLGFFLGTIMGTILLTLFFFLLVTPLGWVARLFGQDFLSQKLDPEAGSYWIQREAKEDKEPEEYERQF